MNIIYLAIEAPREGSASYVHVHEIINGLKRHHVDVTLYEPDYSKKPKSPGLMIRLVHALLVQAKLWVNFSRGSILYVRAHYLAYPTALICRLFGIPIIHEVNGLYEDVFVSHPSLEPYRKILVHMQRWQYKSATGVIAVSEQLQEWVNEEGNRHDCAFISNGANVDLFKPDLPCPADAPEKYVVFFGGLTRWHGVPTMLQAATHNDWPSGVSLVVIGDGQESPAVKEAAKQHAHIIFAGRKAYAEIAPYVAHALAGIVMISDPDKRSSKGVFPLKLFETLACGVPAIVSDLPGQADLIREHGCGYVLPMDDAAALAKTIAHIAGNPAEAKEKGETGRAIIVAEHSWQARARQTHSFLTSLI